MVSRSVTSNALLLLALGGCNIVWGLEREPAPPPVPGEWQTVASGFLHSCAIQTDGSLWCWGGNNRGALGNGTAWSSRFVKIGMP